MLSYRQWRLVNESVLPSFNLGLGRPSNLGIQSQFGLDEAKAAKKKKKKMVDDELVKPGKKADKPSHDEDEDDDEPEVDVDVDEDEDEDEGDEEHDGECGSYCAKCMKAGKKSKKKCSMCKMSAKKKMASEEDHDDDEEDHDEEDHDEEDHDEEDHDEEDHDEEDHDEEDHDEVMSAKYSKKSKKKMYDPSGPNTPKDQADHDEEDHDEEDHDEEDHDEEDHDEEDHDDMGDSDAEAPKMSKKMMLKGGQHKLDANKDGKIDGTDFAMLRAKKGHKKGKKHSKKKNESQQWWDSVNSMLGSDPDHKYNDGCNGLFTPVDMNNLYRGVRE